MVQDTLQTALQRPVTCAMLGIGGCFAAAAGALAAAGAAAAAGGAATLGATGLLDSLPAVKPEQGSKKAEEPSKSSSAGLKVAELWRARKGGMEQQEAVSWSLMNGKQCFPHALY